MSCVEFKAFYLLRDVIVWRARQWQEFYSDSLIVGGCIARVAQRPRVLLGARYGARAMCNWGKLFRGHTCASAECRVSSGASEFGDVAGTCGGAWIGVDQALASCGEWCGVPNPDCRHSAFSACCAHQISANTEQKWSLN